MLAKKRAKWALAAAVDSLITLLSPLMMNGQHQVPSGVSNDCRSALFLCLDNLGDAVMATPAISALKTSFPGCSLTVLTRPVNVPVFQKNPNVDHILTEEAPWWSSRPVSGCLRPSYWRALYRNISRIRKEKFDVIIDLRGDLRHLILFGAAAGPRMLLGYGRTGGEKLLNTHVPYDPSMHEIDKKLALLSPIGISGVRPAPKIWLLPEEIAKARQFVAQLLGNVHPPVILMDPGAKPIQRWPLERYALLASTLRHRFHQPVLVSAGPLYSQCAADLLQKAGEDAVRFVGNMRLRDLMALVAACDLVISSDTGVAHIASAVGTRTLTLFGPTDPNRFWHGATGSRVVQSPEPCCSEELHETCLKQSHPVPGFCMEMISESQVEDAVAEALSGLLLPESIANRQSGPHL